MPFPLIPSRLTNINVTCPISAKNLRVTIRVRIRRNGTCVHFVRRDGIRQNGIRLDEVGINHILLVLMKLRLNLKLNKDPGYRFGI